MNEYWKEHFNANALKFPDSPLKQVEATVYGKEVDKSQLDLIVDAVSKSLRLSDSDHVADLCCGNGIITKEVAKRCGRVSGVDFSENLIHNAQAMHAAENVHYSVSDVAALSDEFFSGPNKGYMCYAVQHLSTRDVGALLRQIAQHDQWTSFFFSGIPDVSKLNVFYDSEEKMAFYRKKEALGEPHLGKWWGHSELADLATEAGLDLAIVPQATLLFTSHYRFDCLVSRR